MDNNSSSENITNGYQENADKDKEDNTATNNKNNDTSFNKAQKEVIVNKDVPSKYELKSLGSLQYYLYTLSNITNNMPLIMYLHCGTNKKLDVESLLTVDGFPI